MSATDSCSPAPPVPAMHLAVGWRTRFLLLCLIWGASFLFIKVGVQEFAPLQVALGRMVLGTGVLLAILFARRERLPTQPIVWLHLTVAAVFLNALPATLFAIAEQRISSAMAGICNGTTPLFTLLLALLALPDERPTTRRGLGLAIGFGGVVLLLAGSGVEGEGSGAFLALAAAACYAVGWTYVRRTLAHRKLSSLSLSAGQLLAATVLLAIATPLATSAPAQISAGPVLAIVALGVFGTGIAYAIQYRLVRDVGATVASTVNYFIPIASILIGVLVAQERLAWNAPVGALIIIAGALVSRAPARLRGRA